METIGAKTAQYGAVNHLIPENLLRQLSNRQILPIYRHQADAISELNDGQNIVIATSAASGKSLCYQIPVVAFVIQDHMNRFLFLYPTKALAQDQLRSLEEIIPLELDFQSAIYEGDTPPKMRVTAAQGVQALLTNPDMLHLGICRIIGYGLLCSVACGMWLLMRHMCIPGCLDHIWRRSYAD